MKPKQNIKLLTYNVFLRPPPIKTNQDDYKEQRFVQILQLITEYDIVCLQEMFFTGSFRLERIIQHAIANKFYFWKKSQPPSFLPGPIVDSGLLVLSKYPIESAHFQSFAVGILSDSASDKGFIYCKIQIKGQFLHLFVTHMQASYMEPGKNLQRQLSVRVRQKQQQILIDRINSLLKLNEFTSHDLVMLVGDLNINAKQQPFTLTKNSYLSERGEHRRLNTSVSFNLTESLNAQKEELYQQFKIFIKTFTRSNLILVDHLYQRYGQHKVTFGESQYVLTDHSQSESHQRLDYIFTVLVKNEGKSKLRALSKTCAVQKYLQPEKKHKLLSDHYGVSIQIEIS